METMDAQLEVEDWEFLHPNDDVPIVFAGPTLNAIRHDHFALLPEDHQPNSNSNSNSNSDSNSNSTSNSDVDRNFDDSYVANQIFSNTTAPWTADSDSDTATAVTVPEAEPAVVESLNAEEEQGENREVEEVKEEGEEKRLVWWKVPFEVLRCWVNPLPLPLPVWSLSVAAAAAFLGLLFLGRRLNRMKRKTQTLKLNLALDDKKVSQLMGRVARLNEAFSVVRRVPIVRPPSLPASSVTLRPVMSMR